MFLQDELVNFINEQNPSKSIIEIVQGLDLIKNGLNNFKQELSKSLPDLYMLGDIKSIENYVVYGTQIDSAIEYIQSLNLKKIDIIKEEELNILSKHKEESMETNKLTKKNDKSIQLFVVEDNICPYCKNELIFTQIMYTLFEDESKTKIKAKTRTNCYRCKICGKYGINKNILKNININISNIEPIYYESEKKAYTMRRTCLKQFKLLLGTL